MLSFEWDKEKEKKNLIKHKIDFSEASTVFLDEEGLLMSDPDHSKNEERYLLLGMSNKGNILIVSHCYRGKEEIIRIISARKANKREARSYIDRKVN